MLHRPFPRSPARAIAGGVAVCLIGLGHLAPAAAQPATADRAEERPAECCEFTATELRAYVSVRREIDAIESAYRDRIEAGTTVDAAAVLRREAAVSIAASIERHGLSLDRFYAIGDAAATDEDTARRIEALPMSLPPGRAAAAAGVPAKCDEIAISADSAAPREPTPVGACPDRIRCGGASRVVGRTAHTMRGSRCSKHCECPPSPRLPPFPPQR